MRLSEMLLGGATEDILASAWSAAVRYHRGHERDFLRELHSVWGLRRLAWAINSDLFGLGKAVSLTSIWLDHTPQCWLERTASGIWEKPSCELADLLVVVWDDESMKGGRALLLQGKMANSPARLIAGGVSTRKERFLLEASPHFLLSNQTSVRKGFSPNPYSKHLKSIFCLDHFGTNASTYRHCRFLQIRKASATRWDSTASPWQAHWPSNAQTVPYARSLAEMVIQRASAAGEHFDRHSCTRDWDALINILIDSTVALCGHGTSKGPAQTGELFTEFRADKTRNPIVGTITSVPAPLSLATDISARIGERIPVADLTFDSESASRWPGVPVADWPDDPDGGISILFLTPYNASRDRH